LGTSWIRSPRRKTSLVLILVLGLAASLSNGQQTNLPPPARGYPFARGTLERLNTGTRQLSVRTPDGTRNFEVTPRTYIFRGKDKITFDKLTIGENLKLNYYTNQLGQALVRRIKVDPPEATK
jgi:hypothetical protein